mmetsp:Transcript_6388/g.18405  ORF Transcript_6388/g.18405 Transcript_6388/m.18405 type:complete len:281 (+) Transcript_6388:410-1252(+)
MSPWRLLGCRRKIRQFQERTEGGTASAGAARYTASMRLKLSTMSPSSTPLKGQPRNCQSLPWTKTATTRLQVGSRLSGAASVTWYTTGLVRPMVRLNVSLLLLRTPAACASSHFWNFPSSKNALALNMLSLVSKPLGTMMMGAAPAMLLDEGRAGFCPDDGLLAGAAGAGLGFGRSTGRLGALDGSGLLPAADCGGGRVTGAALPVAAVALVPGPYVWILMSAKPIDCSVVSGALRSVRLLRFTGIAAGFAFALSCPKPCDRPCVTRISFAFSSTEAKLL